MTAFIEEAATSDWDTLQDGLFISMVGIGVVFVVLLVLALVSWLMQKIDVKYPVNAAAGAAARPRPASPAPPPSPAPAAASPAPTEAVSDAQTAAAIGVALALAELESAPRGVAARPAVRQNGHGAGSWVQSGRSRQLSSWTPGGRGPQR